MQEFDDIGPQQRQSHLEDPELAHVVSLSLKVCLSQFVFSFLPYWWAILVCLR